jgi:hypothetical protein
MTSLRSAVFHLDTIPAFFQGWTDGTTWRDDQGNVWMRPVFSLEVGEQIALAINDETEEDSVSYDRSMDAFIEGALGWAADGLEEIYRPIRTSQGALYGIGAGLWSWKETPQVELDYYDGRIGFPRFGDRESVGTTIPAREVCITTPDGYEEMVIYSTTERRAREIAWTEIMTRRLPNGTKGISVSVRRGREKSI